MITNNKKTLDDQVNKVILQVTHSLDTFTFKWYSNSIESTTYQLQLHEKLRLYVLNNANTVP